MIFRFQINLKTKAISREIGGILPGILRVIFTEVISARIIFITGTIAVILKAI